MSGRLSRRSFLGVATAASIVTIPRPRLAGALDAGSAPERVDCEVAVVGLTVGGLVAARELERRGIRVVVLDDGTNPGTVDPWLTQDHPRLRRLATELGLEIEAMDGDGWVLDGDGATQVPDGALVSGGRSTAELVSAFHKLDRMASELDAAEPWSAVNARVRDARTLGSWLDDSVIGDRARARLHAGLELALGAPSHEVSLLFALAVIESAGGTNSLVRAAYLPEARIAGDLIAALTASLPETPRRVTVRKIDIEGHGVTVDAGGLLVRARQLVVASAQQRDGAVTRFSRGVRVLVACTYASTPWRQQSLSGRVLGDGHPVHAVHVAEGGRTLVAVIAGEAAVRRRRLEPDERRKEVLTLLGRWFGKSAEHPVRYEELTDRCAARVVGAPGALTSDGPDLRANVGSVHSVAPETATTWIGHSEGLVEVGQRVVAELTASLGRHRAGA